MSSIFGGKKSTSNTSNQAYGGLNDAFSPLYGQAQSGASALQKLLGGDSTGFNQFKQGTGFDAALGQGLAGVTGSAAANGLLRSGSTARGLQSFGNNLQNQSANSYMDRLLQQIGVGTQAGGLVSGAGQVQNSQSTEKPGIGKFLGQAASGFAMSDERTKKNIHKVGEYSPGIGLYMFRYKEDDGEQHLGVMAQEVAEHRPEALGPLTADGYMTVNYGAL